jgi:long-subunit acyl-CoA synthetase (AMP-forming)
VTEKANARRLNKTDPFCAPSYAFKKYSQNNFLGTRQKNADGTWGGYKFITYAEAERQAAALASAFRELGIAPVRTHPTTWSCSMTSQEHVCLLIASHQTLWMGWTGRWPIWSN